MIVEEGPGFDKEEALVEVPCSGRGLAEVALAMVEVNPHWVVGERGDTRPDREVA